MSVVFVLGAGASHAERFGEIVRPPGGPPVTNAAPPLLGGFFHSALYESLGYSLEAARQDYPLLFRHLQTQWSSQAGVEPFWNEINIEEVFTSIELDREFSGSESDRGAHLTLVRNNLLRYGEYGRLLVRAAHQRQATTITFNWDLLVDQELLAGCGKIGFC